MQSDGNGSDRKVRAAYVDHASFIRRKLAFYGVPAADVDDVCHDVFLVALRKLPSATPPQARAWLDEVAWRVAVAHHRRRRIRSEVLVGAPPEPAWAPDPQSDLWPCHREERALVRAAVERLEPHARELLALEVIAELPLTEIAKLAQCDPKTARSRLRSAKKRVRGWLRTLEGARRLSSPPATHDETDAARVRFPSQRKPSCERREWVLA